MTKPSGNMRLAESNIVPRGSIKRSPVAHDFIRQQSAESPQAEAIWYRDSSISYGELQRRVNRMARHLALGGVEENDIVGIALGVGPDLIVSMLAILECGAAFLPLEASHPVDRLKAMLADAEVSVLITHDYLYQRFDTLVRDCGGYVLCIEPTAAQIALLSDEPLQRNVTQDHLAYLMYTSGSTGAPKGVEITHGALVNKIAHPGPWGNVNAEVRGALLASIVFDAALAQIFLPLAYGGCVTLIDPDERLQANDLWRVLATARTTVIDATPTWLAAMLDIALPTSQWQPQRVVLGGEVLPPQLLVRLRNLWPQATLVNAYGPTETCIDAVCFTVEPHVDIAAFSQSVPIGKALPNYQLYVLDNELNPLASGVIGELCVGGCGLARGYRKRPQQTAERFIANPFVSGERLYRTGDLVRLRDDGLLEFAGRGDDQIKIRGQRIEIGEVEAVLGRSGIARALAVALVDEKLTAFVVSDSADTLDRLCEYASNKLPHAMQPRRWLVIAELPLTPTGKLDRKALHAVARDCEVRAVSSSCNAARLSDPIEAILQKLWSDVLEIPETEIGRDANFFELGGQSLSAAMLMAKINQTFNVELGLATLFNQSVLMDLALAITQGECSGEISGLVALNRHAGPALFCIPPLGGVGTVYVGLARALAEHCAVYALQSLNLPDESMDMNSLAAHFIARIRAVQPHGPYRLAGYSAGGVVSLVMCEQLSAQGETIADLILIDPYHWVDTDLQIAGKRNPEEMFWQVCREMLGEALDIRDAAADRALPFVKALWEERLLQPLRTEPAFSDALRQQAKLVLPRHADIDVLALLIEGVRNNWSAYHGYCPQPLSVPIGNLLMIQPDADEISLRSNRLAYWRTLTSDRLRGVTVPGYHPSMLMRATTIHAIGNCIKSMHLYSFE